MHLIAQNHLDIILKQYRLLKLLAYRLKQLYIQYQEAHNPKSQKQLELHYKLQYLDKHELADTKKKNLHLQNTIYKYFLHYYYL